MDSDHPQSNYGPQTVRLTCLVLGEPSGDRFHINIAQSETVGRLKDLIKEKQRPAFDAIPANRLKLWNVDMPIDYTLEDALKRFELDLKRCLLPLAILLDVFPRPNKGHLHIVILPTSFRLNCLVLGAGPNNIFGTEIALTETVGALKKSIKDQRRLEFDAIEADRLTLWNVALPIDNMLGHALNTFKLNSKEPLSPAADLLDVFSNFPDKRHLYIIVQPPPMLPPPPPTPSSLVTVRKAYVEQDIETPSKAAIPGNFAVLQRKSTHQVFCSRPRAVADPIPVTLLEPIFAQFVDDCQNYKPTDVDHAFVAKLSQEMCNIYLSEPDRLYNLRQIFETYGITLHAGAVAPSRASTDGHLLVGTHVKVIVEGKNEIGVGGAEPFAEAALHYRKFLESVEGGMFEEHKAILPCFNLICFGACIGIVGTVFSTKVQCDILVPIIPLFWHSTDLPMETMAARTFGAFKVAVKKLGAPSITTPKPLRGEGTIICPYPRDYIDSAGILQEFTYDKGQFFRERLIFYGKNTSGAKICVKFARTYSPHAHMFCASKGHAPKLIAYNPLPGGWNMIVMDFIDIDNYYRAGSYRYFSRDIPGIHSMKTSITTLIKELHTEGYVHGDLRDVNIFVQDEGTAISNFMLIDFDWAGPVGQTRYPLGVNRLGIYRPDNAQGGCLVLAEDDLDMLRSLFCPEASSGQKRKRPDEEAAPTSPNT